MKRDPFTHCKKCHLHQSQWGGVCDHTNCEHESEPIPRINKEAFIEKAAWAYKRKILEARQGILGKDIMDDFALKLNSEPTYEERTLVNFMWEIFESLGAQYFEQADKKKMEKILEQE